MVYCFNIIIIIIFAFENIWTTVFAWFPTHPACADVASVFQGIFVTKVQSGGPADACLQKGDKLLEVDRYDITFFFINNDF